jgi:hypothetical protein
MHDAIAIANLIYAMPCKTQEDITKIFEEYHQERLPAVMESFENSQIMKKTTSRGIGSTLYRFMIANMPFWLWKFGVRFICLVNPFTGL